MSADLDRLDLKILDRLQIDAADSSSAIAEHVGLSQSPCWRRIQRLKDQGYVKRQVAILDREKFGESMYIFAQLKVSRLTDDQRERFVNALQDIDEVTEAYTLFGEMDVILKVLAPNIAWYQNFTFRRLLRLPGVEDVRSTATLSELKCTHRIPLPAL
ncbi:Lrp/AsnC family transcriptional regulator [Pelagerythrobacter marinus]|jgi:Lrp/AsnC family transcriptional regulator|uniref:AsnC family transcriptional regulator n=1 Tax=Pelagerythrobacter marinus TaxID=538382 RepID=A0ABW9V3I9_9SPHN|nr:Lrp/AsnC family transcriptional regulator [Pelagerythrobacter marinus]MEC9067330.1 Lrp/AsnC family transcriptional regulator [Pseudomonadota bacterium]MXO69502.1 AsnC family transcriptional regulator [Pelagerythrobacter marinus]USA39467.1 Lrp/AsnC family transcriptional regulator [Pelagerythrobacter marinus]WPZ06393.1 Lrp/AsnC family transcriptional regulator [Pelagerythrobacter marinus]